MTSKLPSITNALTSSTHVLDYSQSNQHTRTIEKVLSLKYQSAADIFDSTLEGPLLHRFWAEGLISSDFQISQAQETTVKRLFEKWCLHREICLIDLLGVDIYQSIDRMRATLNPDTKAEFCTYMYLLYLYLHRLEHSQLGPFPLDKKLEVLHYVGKDALVQKFRFIKEQIEIAGIIKSSQIENNKTISHETRRFLISKVQGQINESNDVIDLLVFLVESKYANELLIDRCLMFFNGSGVIEKDHKSTIPHLKIYLAFSTDLFNFALKNKKCAFRGLDFNFLNLEISRKELPQLIDRCKDKMATIERSKEKVKMNYALAKSGRLTHSDWLKINEVKQSSKKDQDEFTEVLFQQALTLQTFIHFIKDALTIIDEIVLPGNYRNWVKQVNIVYRFWINLSMIQSDFSDKPAPSEIHRIIRERLLEEFNPLLSPLIKMYEKNELEGIAFTKEDVIENERRKISEELGASTSSHVGDQVLRQEVPHETRLRLQQDDSESIIRVVSMDDLPLPTSQEMEPLIATFDAKMKLLPNILKELETVFREQLMKIPEEQRNLAYFRKCCFEECLRYCRMAFILNDYRALKGKIDNLYEFPEELADFIQLEGLDDIFSVATQENDSAGSASEIISPSPDIIPTLEKLAESLADVRVSVAEKNEVPEIEKEAPEMEPFILKSRNVRKVIKQLTDAGFFLVRDKRHQVYKLNETGPQVVVPKHVELKTGTLASVQLQAAVALEALARTEQA